MDDMNNCAGCGEPTRHMKDKCCNTCYRKLHEGHTCGKKARCYKAGECPLKENCMWQSEDNVKKMAKALSKCLAIAIGDDKAR